MIYESALNNIKLESRLVHEAAAHSGLCIMKCVKTKMMYGRESYILNLEWESAISKIGCGASYLPAKASPAIGNLLRQIRFAYQISMTTCSALKRRQAGL
ncbi:hypothetical protein A2671_00445 [Candidatus Kaiserbacteria bacterium RIFCSPHIGHO2_01_FULL_49_13]|uniref:Uncharacterized protein n=1 Tax=Candidatus Kaiserbacteria bacterium RIFCSPHIGHO2_01_FULL_49_13 TaxID=1798477 RepID=A0A1F6CCV0_9BACT|nr:MAG: hypothetical protein A2671_00445 [Candidatus Kaiserbacteria bacterium RIFCSPHIGHO2_01_FULL_49_13]